jgi:hypothetical protein
MPGKTWTSLASEIVLLNQEIEVGNRQGTSPSGRTGFVSGKTLERAKRFLLFLWGIYLRAQGIREENLPPITIVIPAGSSEKLRQTVQALLGSRYRQLRLVVTGKVDPEVVDSAGSRAVVKFFEAEPALSRSQMIRQILLQSSDPVFAWLEPGETFSFDTLNRVGRIFRRNGGVGGVVVQSAFSGPDFAKASSGNVNRAARLEPRPAMGVVKLPDRIQC